MESNDKNIKKWVKDHEVPVDFDQLWQKLEPHVPQKKKRRPILWIFGLAGAFLATVLMIDYSNQNSYVAHEEYVMTSIQNSTNIADNIKNTSIEEVLNSYHVITKTQNIESKLENNKHEFGTESINKQEGVGNQTLKKVSNEPVTTTKIEVLLNVPLIQNETKINPEKDVFETQIASGNRYTEILSLESANLATLSTIADITVLEKKTLNMLFSQSNFKFNHPLLITPEASSSSIKQTIFGKLGIGTFTSSDKIQGKPLEHLKLDLGSSIKLNHNWSISLGLSFNRYTTQLLHSHREFKRPESNGTVEIIIDENGNQRNISGALFTTEITTREIKWHTFHYVIEIPFSLRYQLYNHKKHEINAFAGPTLTLFTFGDGAFIDRENLLVKYETKSNPYQYERWSWGSGIDWRWKCFSTGGFQLGLDYNIRNLKLNLSDSSEKLSFTSYLIQLGYFKNL